jgi:glycosyltransferase involved in cell wall biosynthesis
MDPLDLYGSPTTEAPVHTTIVVPCYNEESRWDAGAFIAAGNVKSLSFLFVDDGSLDATAGVLHSTAAQMPRSRVLRLTKNSGKGEAVRQGLRAALADGAEAVGYLDADLSTPISEILRISAVIKPGTRDVVLGSRVLLLGTMVRRNPVRHYLGRAFATAASATLGIPVYDTQCGAKCFSRHEALEAALRDPFHSRWAFDVELLGRLLRGIGGAPGIPLERFAEVPLRQWTHVGGSKISPLDFPRMAFELVKIRRHLAALR